ncbi:MAG: hypothetical protein FJ404_16155 [Verrucomicrobia bacterium]|nr:hypothetical protein [Verrucomicrobiota bacterium]
MQTPSFDEVLEKILEQDPRFHRDAYHFIREALDHTQKMMNRSEKDVVRHVTGQELLAGIRDFALKQYGPMTKTLLEAWGVTRCADFGDLVFNMVESNLLAKTETDSRDDFKEGYDFDEAFRRPFLPRASRQPASPDSGAVSKA